ncbi:anaerobic ribonucleoside-triphosphate reductase activating protein [Methanocella sp. MCL-LM]|uniref:anaerobic ribonucleoside-triphosphate reductase activating protein n=1 Tax=Methanocella sp. MCL-LM TaxID=3412035 RepID=UPI003C775D91
MQVYLGDIIPTSTLDWPGKVVLAIFLKGCPFRCPYCANPQFIEPDSGEPTDTDRVIAEIDKAKDFIDGVVFSGGEPLMQFAAFETIAAHAKSLGLLVGIQTNGAYPERIGKLVEEGLLDAVLLDVKAPPEPEKYLRAAGVPDRKETSDAVYGSVRLCNGFRSEGKLAYYEVRTTVFAGISNTPEEIAAIAAELACDAYVLQQGRPEIAMDENIRKLEAVPRNELMELARLVKSDQIRTVKDRTREMGDEIVRPQK